MVTHNETERKLIAAEALQCHYLRHGSIYNDRLTRRHSFRCSIWINVPVIYHELLLRSPKHYMSMKHYETKMCKVLTHCPTALTQDSEVIFIEIICSPDEDSLWQKVRHGAHKVNTWSNGHVSGGRADSCGQMAGGVPTHSRADGFKWSEWRGRRSRAALDSTFARSSPPAHRHVDVGYVQPAPRTHSDFITGSSRSTEITHHITNQNMKIWVTSTSTRTFWNTNCRKLHAAEIRLSTSIKNLKM